MNSINSSTNSSTTTVTMTALLCIDSWYRNGDDMSHTDYIILDYGDAPKGMLYQDPLRTGRFDSVRHHEEFDTFYAAAAEKANGYKTSVMVTWVVDLIRSEDLEDENGHIEWVPNLYTV